MTSNQRIQHLLHSKKDDNPNKENYRPVSILPHLSKVFERILYKQIDSFMENTFSPYLCEFRKSHNAQYSLPKVIEKKKQLDNGEKVGVIFIALHNLRFAKLKAYVFSDQDSGLLQNYLCIRFQRSIIDGSFTSWNEKIISTQILGPLLFTYF